MNAIVHGGYIVVLSLQLICYAVFSHKFGGRISALAAFMIFAIGTAFLFASLFLDGLITPALASAPPRAVSWATRSWAANMAASVRYAPYAAPWNVAGFPGVVVPSGVRADGLPSAVQLVGPPGSELTLLALAGQLEKLAPWRRHAPGWPRTSSHKARSTL